ncbi:hypothetical protein [Microcoleus phage My-WqHQDG]|nr:hypothetical protein [Microcoleus phage My-WqHQDG]
MNIYATPSSLTGTGTISNPTTLQDACSIAVSGDTIHLAPGTYRGTYNPASGVTLVGDGSATITGLDVVTGFTQSNGFYTAPATPLTPLAYSMGADQVFIDGVEVLESRWPMATVGTRGDISSWAECTAVSITTSGSNYEATYTVPGIPGGNLTDCHAHVLNGYQWVSIGGQVLASTANTVTVRFTNDGNEYNRPIVGSRFYLWGGATLPHGFHMASSLLHLPSNPGSSMVEVKARHWGIDVRGRTGVVVRGITLQSCSVHTDDGTKGLVLESMGIYNMTHAQAPTDYWGGPNGHLTLRDGGVIRDTVVKHCAGAFANVRGDGCVVDNITVIDTSYSGICQSAMDLQDSNHIVTRSTFGMAGAQSLLDLRRATNCTFRGCEAYGGGGILTDGGTVMFADSATNADQGCEIKECVIHDTRGRTGPQSHLYGNAGVYIEGNASINVRDCHMWGATSNDLQVVPLDGMAGTVLVENCTLGTLGLTYSGASPSIPVTYRDNIVRAINAGGSLNGGGSLNTATVVGNLIDRHTLPGNLQAPNIFSTLDRGYPGAYTPPGKGARGGPLYYYGAYDRSLLYTSSVTRNPLTGGVKVRLDGPPPPDGFTVTQGSTTGIVRQFIEPYPHLEVTFPPTVSGLVDITLSAPSSITKVITLLIPGDLRVTSSSGLTINGAGFTPAALTKVLVTITSSEESWDVPIPVPVNTYITQGLMGATGTGLATREGFPLYVDPTYPVGGTHAWVRVPYIPTGTSTFTLLLGGTTNISSSESVFLESDLHLQDDTYIKQLYEGITIAVDGTDLVMSGTTTSVSQFEYLGISLPLSYVFGDRHPTRSFSWDSYISMAPNTADYWWAVLGNNSFILGSAGSDVSGNTNQPSTMGREFSHKLVSNIQLPTSMLWEEDLTTINTKDGLPNSKGTFTMMVGQVDKAIEFRWHYIRARAVPNSGVLPTTGSTVIPSATRLWIDGSEYTPSIITSSTMELGVVPLLQPGAYDVRVLLPNGEDYLLEGGYTVPALMPTPAPAPAPTPMPVLVVSNTLDNGVGSLRAVVAVASPSDTITFDPSLSGQTITLTSGQVEVSVGKNIIIDGSAAPGLTISGNNTSRIFSISANVVTPTTVTIKNLTLGNGKTTGRGGAITTTDEVVLVVDHVVFNANVADLGGGAIFSGYNNQLTVLDSKFNANLGTAGNDERGAGAIAFFSGKAITIIRSEFTSNRGINGGAINSLQGKLSISDCKFIGNDTLAGFYDTGKDNPFLRGRGGAIYTDRASSPEEATGTISISNSTFQSNKGRGEGGAKYLFTGNQDSVTLDKVTYLDNEVLPLGDDAPGNGGAICILCDGSNQGLVISNSGFVGNKADNQGGGLWTRNAPTTITNCTFSGNSTGYADGDYGRLGGAMILGSFTAITNTTIADNTAGWVGGGICASPLDVSLKNTIFYNNSASNGGNPWGIQQHSTDEYIDLGGNYQWPLIDSDTRVTASVVVANPLLGSIQTINGSLVRPLLVGSPAIDKGVSSGAPSIDQVGTPRPQDGDTIVGAVVDSGSFEYKVTPTPAPAPAPVPTPAPTPVPAPAVINNPIVIRELGYGPLAVRPPLPNPGQVYISYEGICYAYSNGQWAPYQVINVSTTRQALPITGTWPLGTLLVMVGTIVPPSNILPLSGLELPLSSNGALYSALSSSLGAPLPKTNGYGVVGTTHFLLPNYRSGMISIPGEMGIGFGGHVVHLPGQDYPIQWLVVV